MNNELPSMLDEELQNLHQQFESIKSEAQTLLGDLTEIQFNWQASPNRWSIAQCIDHLLVTGGDSLSNMHRAINEARSKGLFSRGPFRYGVIERWFVRQMEPRARMKLKTPKAYIPRSEWLGAEIVRNFYGLQDRFLRCIEEADGIDLSRVKVNNPVSKWMRLSLGQELALNAAHERRHLWQANRVKQERDFPRTPAVV